MSAAFLQPPPISLPHQLMGVQGLPTSPTRLFSLDLRWMIFIKNHLPPAPLGPVLWSRVCPRSSFAGWPASVDSNLDCETLFPHPAGVLTKGGEMFVLWCERQAPERDRGRVDTSHTRTLSCLAWMFVGSVSYFVKAPFYKWAEARNSFVRVSFPLPFPSLPPQFYFSSKGSVCVCAGSRRVERRLE